MKLERKRCKHCHKKMRWLSTSCKICRGQCHRRCARNSKSCVVDCDEESRDASKVSKTYAWEKKVESSREGSRSRSFSDAGHRRKRLQEQHSLDVYDRRPSLFGSFIRRRHTFSFAFQSRDDFDMYQSCCKAELVRILKAHREVVGVSELTPSTDESMSTSEPASQEHLVENINETLSSGVSRVTQGESVEETSSPSGLSGFGRVPDIPSSLKEWTIPMDGIIIEEEIARCRKGVVYRGKWHGDVYMYTQHNTTDEAYTHFLEEVSILSLIRHENIVLFMGACTDPARLAIVTSCIKARTLHNQIFIRQHAVGFETSLAIAKQIAQGIGYLHAKGIAIGDLCSRNIFLDSKVKVAMTDCMWRQLPITKPHVGFASSGHLSYICPEQMQTLFVGTRNVLTSTLQNTCPSDMFAYGTVLYELFCGTHPFEGIQPEQVVWKICKGQHASVGRFGTHTLIKDITLSCWALDPLQRLSCEDVLGRLKKLRIPKLLLQRQLSLSEPEDMDKLTTFKFRNRSP